MIPSSEFILFYNELFKFIDVRHGKQEVVRLWEAISDNFLANLDEHVRKEGLKGMYEYWSHTLGEEGGRWTMTLRDDEFIIDMHACPSIARINSSHLEPYEDYCGHCAVLYPRVLEKHGYNCYYDIIDPKRGACRLQVRKVGKDENW
jgi:hypothetical protein